MQTFLLERVRDHVLVANVQVFHGVPPSPYYDEETARAEERERTGIARLSWYTCVRNTRSIVLWVAIITSFPISGEPRMRACVGWKLKVNACRPRTGCSTCKSSLQEAISVRLHLSTTKFGGMWGILPDLEASKLAAAWRYTTTVYLYTPHIDTHHNQHK
jgi:hypothetical protein